MNLNLTLKRNASLFLLLTAFLLPAYAYSAPKILYTDISSGPNSGGENNSGAYLSIFGKDFGSDISNVQVFVGNGEVARYMYLGKSYGRPDVQQLSVQLGASTTSGTIRVVVVGQESNTDHNFTVRPGDFYFVSASGDDATGEVNNINRPFRSPNYVVQDTGTFSAGDFVIVRGGTYVFSDNANNISSNAWLRADRSGTSNAPMALLGYPGETVDIQHSDNTAIISNYVSISNWVVGNFLVTLTDCVGDGEFIYIGMTTTPAVCNDTTESVQGKAKFIKIVNIEADGKDTGGFCSGGDGLVEIGYSEGVRILGLSLHNTSPAQGDSESAHALYLAARQKNTELGWNAVYNIPATRAVVQVHQDSFGGECWGSKEKGITDVSIHDNLLHDLAGQAILLDGGVGDVQVYNNIIYNHKDHRYDDVIALRGGGGTLNAKLFNNTIYANSNEGAQGALVGIGFAGSFPQTVTLYNNIFYATDAQDDYYNTGNSGSSLTAWINTPGNLTTDNNIWFGSSSSLPPFAGPNAINMDPMFIDTSVANFHLPGVSPAIDQGSSLTNTVVSTDYDGNVRPQGLAPDIGSFESTGVTLPRPQNVHIQKL